MSVDKLTWYTSRSGGIVAWALLALGLILGLLLSSKLLGRKAPPSWLLAFHRYMGGLALTFTGVHVGAIMLDDFVDFGPSDVLVPMASQWRPGAVAWGIIGMYLLVAIEVTSFAMRRLPRRLWRAVHSSSAALFVTATVHAYQAGTDIGRTFIIAICGVAATLSVLTTFRVVRARSITGQPSVTTTGERMPLHSHADHAPRTLAEALERVPDHLSDISVATDPEQASRPPARAWVRSDADPSNGAAGGMEEAGEPSTPSPPPRVRYPSWR